ncbi:MAG: hypothetical protein ACRDLK_09670 [Gaiellaceae bacterium]
MSERFDTFSPPPPDPDPWAAASETEEADEGGALDPREAAALLAQTTQQAERQFAVRPPFLIFTAAVTVLVAYGAVWLSVRNQHPYSGPTGTGLAVLYGTLGVWSVFVATVLRRALGGRSSRQRRLDGVAFAAIWICVYVFQGALYHAGAGDAIAYGIYPAVAPLLIVGSASAACEIAREKPAAACLALAAVVLAAIGAFAGPVTVWAVMGVGLCALLLVATGAQLWTHRARP